MNWVATWEFLNNGIATVEWQDDCQSDDSNMQKFLVQDNTTFITF